MATGDFEHDLSHGASRTGDAPKKFLKAEAEDLNLGRCEPHGQRSRMEDGGLRGAESAASTAGSDCEDLTGFCQEHGVSEATVFAVEGAFAQLEKVLALRHDLAPETVKAIRELLFGGGAQRRQNANGGSPSHFTPAQWQSSFTKILRYIRKHPSTPDIYAALHVWDNPALDDVNCHMDQVSFAASIGVTRARVSDAVVLAREHFGLPPRKGERSEDARANMAEKRRSQLKKKPVRG